MRKKLTKMTLVNSILPWMVVVGENEDDNDGEFVVDNNKERTSTTTVSRFRLVIIILAVRLFYLSAMAISCHLIPDHSPGDDVLRFNLRLDNDDSFATDTAAAVFHVGGRDGSGGGCFCRKGHACEVVAWDHLDAADGAAKLDDRGDDTCAIFWDDVTASSTETSVATPVVSSAMWKFLLAPVTKWDAARFLTLAVQPTVRDPGNNERECTTPECFETKYWQTSEQAHAFLPMFPWVLRTLALCWFRWTPTLLRRHLLPPTFEALVAISGLVFNNVFCLIVAVLALYELTFRECRFFMSPSSAASISTATCLVFGVWNPASVFFASNYSESFFCATTLVGHVCMQRRRRQRPWQANSLFWWCLGVASWMIGSYTRSNGTIHCLWLLEDALATAMQTYNQHWRGDNQLKCFAAISLLCMQCLLGVFLVALPVRFHDWEGYQRHCGALACSERPTWCGSREKFYTSGIANFLGDHGGLLSSFSLYAYVQEKHWNVGPFRYYTWNQIPNFFLAMPILGLSITGIYKWIIGSLIVDYGKGKLPKSLSIILYGWPLYALPESVTVPKVVKEVEILEASEQLVRNPRLLGHYALLTILTMVGVVLAHIQITTRMICSSSPANLWFLTYCMLSKRQSLSKIVWCYCMLYLILGVVLHVNFLPWT